MKNFFNRIRYDFFLVLALLGLAAGIYALRAVPGREVFVRVNGVAATESMEINGVAVEINGARARIADSPCRDRICVNAGWLEKPGDTAICLPQRVVVEIAGGKKAAFDGVAG